MNILFLTMGRFDSIESHSIYADLLRCFRNHGHEIYTITPNEKRSRKKTELIHERGAHILHLKTGNVTGKSNLIRKGIAQIAIEPTYINAIKKYFSNVKFELVLYSTPPITFCNAIKFVQKRDNAESYLLLKDIFPQNAVDLGMITKNGIKGIIYKYFRAKEKKLYNISNHIGCMSKANVKYVLDHNPEIAPNKVEVCPNAIEIVDQSVSTETRKKIREKYSIPQDKMVFVYGGNLGKPQDIPFLIECLKEVQNVKNVYFLIVGNGNDYEKLKFFVKQEKPENIKLLSVLPKEDYDSMVGACDVGLIFLDHRFTIPNFPSRLLTYMQAKLPVLAVTDPNTDIGKIIVNGGFGWWCESNDPSLFFQKLICIVNSDISLYKKNAWNYLRKHFSTELAFEIIMSRLE